MHLRKALLVKVELQKILDSKFIKTIAYSKWVLNPIIIPKPDRCIRICIDFRDINKAYPKDGFLLPNIDILGDNTTGHEIFSLMDGFSSYNEIMIMEEDNHKMAFITLGNLLL